MAKDKVYRIVVDFMSPYKYNERQFEFLNDYMEEFCNEDDEIYLGCKLVDPVDGQTYFSSLKTEKKKKKKK